MSDVLADVIDEPVINKLLKDLSIGGVSDALTANALDTAMVDNDGMLDCDPIIMEGDSIIGLGFAVSLSLE